MKKILLWATLAIVIVCVMGAVLTTKVAPYTTLLVSAEGAETDLVPATGYAVGVPNPGGTLNPLNIKDLASDKGSSTQASAPILICFATASEDDDVTISYYGIRRGGAPERLFSLVWTFGQAIRSSGVRWADTCVVTATSSRPNPVMIEDSGNNRIVSVLFDARGFEHIYGIAHTTTTGAPTIITNELSYY
jgi:hypothetical protein